MQFTFNDYESSLAYALKKGYVFTPAAEFVNMVKSQRIPDKFIILRHDCERDLSKAYQLALIENKLGINSTYFIRLHSEWYNIHQKEEYLYINKIISLGHEIGLHYEPKFYSEINIDFISGLKNDIKILNQLYTVKSISAHQPLLHPPKKGDFESLELVDMYTSNYFQKISYYSDSGMKFREYSLKEVILKNINCQFLIHPDFWNECELSWSENYSNIVEKVIMKLKNFEKFEKDVYDNYIKTRETKDKLFFNKK